MLTRQAPGFGQAMLTAGGKRPAAFYREMILATLRALADGRITQEEIPIAPRTDPRTLRYAPGLSTASPATGLDTAYTINSLAAFLGAVGDDGYAVDDFKAAFAALELIEDGFIKESATAWTEPLLSFLTEAVVYWRVNTVLRNEISDSLPRIAKGASRLAPLLAIRERAANSVTAYNSVRPRAWAAHHRNCPTPQ